MGGKLGMLGGCGAGYVLGARAGRERYEQIVKQFQKARHDPRVEKAAEQVVGVAAAQAQQARETAEDAAAQARDGVKEKAADAIDSAKGATGEQRAPGTAP